MPQNSVSASARYGVTLSTCGVDGIVFSLSLFLLFPEDRASSSLGRFERRLISLIFAGRNRIIMIRRELPLTVIASPVEPVALAKRGFSFVLALAAAGSVLEMDGAFHQRNGFCFFLIWKVFAFVLVRLQLAG